MKVEDIASSPIREKEVQMEPTIKTTEKVVNIKAQKAAKPKAAPKKAGRPRNVQEFTATEMKQVASKLRPVQ